MQAVLVMFRADGERRSFSITRDMTVVGRRQDCDLRIPHGDVSRKHCRFVRDSDSLRIEDLGSSNGTYHNGARIDRDAILQAGDSIQIGPVVFVLQIDGQPNDNELHPITADAGSAPMYSGEGWDESLPQEPTERAWTEQTDGEPSFKAEPEADGLAELEPLSELDPVAPNDLMTEPEPFILDEVADGSPMPPPPPPPPPGRRGPPPPPPPAPAHDEHLEHLEALEELEPLPPLSEDEHLG